MVESNQSQGSDPESFTPLQEISLVQRFVNCTGTVIRKSGPFNFLYNGEQRQRASIILRDATGEKTVLFWTETIPQFHATALWDEVEITGMYPKAGYHDPASIELHLRPDSLVHVRRKSLEPTGDAAMQNAKSTANSQPVGLLPARGMLPTGETTVSQLHAGEMTTLQGTLPVPFTRVNFYEACPRCWRKAGTCTCPEASSPILRAIINATLADQTGTIRTTFFGDLATQLAGISAVELKAKYGSPAFDEYIRERTNALAERTFKFIGRAKDNPFAAWQGLSTPLDFMVQAFEALPAPSSPPSPASPANTAVINDLGQIPTGFTPAVAAAPAPPSEAVPEQNDTIPRPISPAIPVEFVNPPVNAVENTKQTQPFVSPARCPQVYAPTKIYITKDGFLTAPLPYWLGKLLIAQKHLRFAGDRYQVDQLDDGSIEYVVESAPECIPLRGRTPKTLNLTTEESLLASLEDKLGTILSLIDQCITLFQQVKQVNLTRGDPLGDIDAALTLLASIEDRERDVQEQGYLWSIAGFLAERTHVSDDLALLHQSRALTVDLTYWKGTCVLEDLAPAIALVQSILDGWCECREVFQSLFSLLLDQVSLLEPETSQAPASLPTSLPANLPILAHEPPPLFGGQSFAFFAFDINNLHVSAKQKFPRGHLPVPQRIREKVLPRKDPHLAYYFASLHFKDLRRFAPDDAHNKWFFEKVIKNWENGRVNYCDVDATLSAEVGSFLAQYHAQITRFTLGSGDKDFHHTCDMAKKYGIPVDVVVVDKEANLSRELAAIADRVIELFT